MSNLMGWRTREKIMKKILTVLSLSVALTVPVCLQAQDHDRDDRHHDRDDRHDRRYYDRHRRDYHEWNGNEDRAYHMYWEQQRHPYVDWDRANEAQRQRYWDWRHRHSDSVLRIDIH